MRDHRTSRAAGILALLVLTAPLALLASEAGQPYRQQYARHGQIRNRAEELSRQPRLSRYDVKIAEARVTDDREMKRFDIQASTPGGSAAAAPRLKLYNDELEATVKKMLDYLQR